MRSSAAVSAMDAHRDVRVIGLMGSVHFVSHFFQLTLPPLFPLLTVEFGVGYAALGLVMTAFYCASGVGQAIAGFVVDRAGAPRVLAAGIGLLAAGIALSGLVPSYGALLLVTLLAGVGNSVFHPADYAIMNGVVDPRRLGRAYSVHGIGGQLGWVVAPPVVVTLSAMLGWRAALMTVGLLGLGVAGAIAAQATVLESRAVPAGRAALRGGQGLAGDIQLLLQRPILVSFAYFALLAMALIGIQTFSVSALMAIHRAPLELATGALTGFLLGSAVGVFLGGFVADRTTRHEVVAGGGMSLGAAVVLLLAVPGVMHAGLPVIMVLAGLSLGMAQPSRDMLVRAATPAGASGKVYGFVYSGLDLGSFLIPLPLGWLLDHEAPRAVFVVSAVFMLLTAAIALEVRRAGTRGVAPA